MRGLAASGPTVGLEGAPGLQRDLRDQVRGLAALSSGPAHSVPDRLGFSV